MLILFIYFISDLALLHLNKPFEVSFTDNIDVIRLNTKFAWETMFGKNVLVSGWGSTSYGEPSSEYLMKVTLIVRSSKLLCHMIENMNLPEMKNFLHRHSRTCQDSILMSQEKGQGVCYGDSGGTTIQKYTINIPKLGITIIKNIQRFCSMM